MSEKLTPEELAHIKTQVGDVEVVRRLLAHIAVIEGEREALRAENVILLEGANSDVLKIAILVRECYTLKDEIYESIRSRSVGPGGPDPLW